MAYKEPKVTLRKDGNHRKPDLIFQKTVRGSQRRKPGRHLSLCWGYREYDNYIRRLFRPSQGLYEDSKIQGSMY